MRDKMLYLEMKQFGVQFRKKVMSIGYKYHTYSILILFMLWFQSYALTFIT
jgi:hypothetical protein